VSDDRHIRSDVGAVVQGDGYLVGDGAADMRGDHLRS